MIQTSTHNAHIGLLTGVGPFMSRRINASSTTTDYGDLGLT